MNHYAYTQLKRVFDLQRDKLVLKLEKNYYDDSNCPLGEIQCERKKLKLAEFDLKIQLLELEVKEIEAHLLELKNKK
jgi:hypothetical protein